MGSCTVVPVRVAFWQDDLKRWLIGQLTELKELIALHATTGQLGGDLKADTVNIIGATLDLQEKVTPTHLSRASSVDLFLSIRSCAKP